MSDPTHVRCYESAPSGRLAFRFAREELLVQLSGMPNGNPSRVVMILFVCFTMVLPVQAGMTVYGLNDVYRIRLEELSFFIVLLLTCSFIFKLVWNHATKGFSFLPRLKFLQALCMSLIFGLTTLLILTMISGIREVLSPGVWRKQGTSYRLNDPSQEPARRKALEQLREALFDYARHRGGDFPPHDFVAEIPSRLWESPDQLGTHYYYFGGLKTNAPSRLLAMEPPIFGEHRFVLMTSGEIEKLSAREIRQWDQWLTQDERR